VGVLVGRPPQRSRSYVLVLPLRRCVGVAGKLRTDLRSAVCATGILMERHAIDENRAFEMLRERSRIDNRKLIDLAAAVVDGHRFLPGQSQAPLLKARACPPSRMSGGKASVAAGALNALPTNRQCGGAASAARLARWRHDQHRTERDVEQSLGNAPDQQPGERRMTSGAHDDHVGACGAAGGSDRVGNG
jgi:ANTAR domain